MRKPNIYALGIFVLVVVLLILFAMELVVVLEGGSEVTMGDVNYLMVIAFSFSALLALYYFYITKF